MIRSAVLCLDQGGHSSRAVIYGNDGTHLATAAVPVATRRDETTAEHDPDEIVTSLVTAAEQALGEIPAHLPVTCAGLATQRSTMLCWDSADARPLTPAISWQDRRGEVHLPKDKPTLDLLRRITGLAAQRPLRRVQVPRLPGLHPGRRPCAGRRPAALGPAGQLSGAAPDERADRHSRPGERLAHAALVPA